MISYIRPPDTLEFDPTFFDTMSHSTAQYFIIELGSGSGLVASTIAGLLRPGRDLLIVTDLPEVWIMKAIHVISGLMTGSSKVCSLLEQNLKKLPVVVKALSWGNQSEAINICSAFIGKEYSPSSCGNLTHIICSDLVLSSIESCVTTLITYQIYFPGLFAPLLRTLLDLTSPPFVAELGKTLARPLIFISYKVRSLTKESTFWAAFGLWFDFRPVLVRETLRPNSDQWRCFGVKSDDTTFLFVAHRRPESYLWTIPLLDEELLSGVGVNGSDFPKSDDTFERLLMMMSLEHE